MWILFAFLSAIFAGATAILAKIGLRSTDSDLATALRTIVVLVFAWLMVLLTGSIYDITAITGKTFLFLFLSGLATGASWICYFKALQLGDVNKVTPVDKSSLILTMILAGIFLGEGFTTVKIFCMLLIGIGTYLMIEFRRQPQAEKKKGTGWFFYALASAIFAAMTTILGKIGVESIDSNLGTAIRTVFVLIMAWIIVFARGKQKQIKDIDKRSWVFIGLSGFATGLSWLCYYRALQTGDASIVAPIDKLSIVFTIFFSFVILKEKLSRRGLLGLLFIVTGTLLLLV